MQTCMSSVVEPMLSRCMCFERLFVPGLLRSSFKPGRFQLPVADIIVKRFCDALCIVFMFPVLARIGLGSLSWESSSDS